MCCVCNYPYKIKKSNFADLFLSETFSAAFATVLFWVLAALYGWAIRTFLPLVSDIDIFKYLSDQMNFTDLVWLRREAEVNKLASFTISLLPDLSVRNSFIPTLFQAVFVGMCAMGVTGIVLSITCDVTVFVRDRMAIGVQVAVPNLYFLFAFVMNRVYIIRVGVPLGCAYLAMKVFITYDIS